MLMRLGTAFDVGQRFRGFKIISNFEINNFKVKKPLASWDWSLVSQSWSKESVDMDKLNLEIVMLIPSFHEA